MKLLHARVVSPDAISPASQRIGNLGQLVDVALEDTALLHKMLHALVTGRDLPTTVPGNSRDMPSLLAPYVMTEVCRKVNHFMAQSHIAPSHGLISHCPCHHPPQ